MSQQTTLQCTGAAFLSYINPNTNISNLTNLPTCYYFYDGETLGDQTKSLLQSKTPLYDFGAAAFDFENNNVLINKRIQNVKLYYTVSGTERTPKLRPSSNEYYSEGWLIYNRPDISINQLTLNNLGELNYGGNDDLTEQITTSTTSFTETIEFGEYYWDIYRDLAQDGTPPRIVICSGRSKYPYYYALQASDIDYPMVKEFDADNPGQGGNNRTIAKSSVYLVVTWDYIAPDTPTINSPINAGFVEDEPITFSWNYNSQISSPQASATIEYKLSSASTWTTVTSSGAGTTYTLNAGLSAGSYQWRVKVTDGQGETSSYSATKTFTVVEQAAPTPTYPVDTGLPAYAPIAFTWTFNKPSGSSATQAGATLQYRERGGSTWTDVTVSGSSATYTLQAGLAVGQYEWRVKVTNNYGNDSAYCNIKYFQIVAQSAPTPVSPGDNITLFEGHDITFTWVYNSLTPATQASATIKYRVRGGSTWTTYTSTSSNPYCTISYIPQGQYEWCLNITNNYGETSADSGTLEFNIIGRPQKPIILEPDNCCLTTISWNAEGQEAAEFILMDGDGNVLIHETVATAVTSYKPQMFLKGSYKAMARIKNNSDLWSDYGELEFDIDAAEPDPGNLIAMPFDTEIHLEGTYTSTNVAIVRIDEDGTETVLAMDDHAIDKKVASGTEYAYVLRSWDTGGYIDTPAKVFDFKFEGAIFSTETEELHLDRSEQKFLTHDEEIERQYAQMRYVGREFAVIERGEYTEQTLSKQFHVTKAQRRILDRMAKEKSLFYRDSRGNAFKAAILNVSYSNYMGNDYIASIRLTRTAADEVIINV